MSKASPRCLSPSVVNESFSDAVYAAESAKIPASCPGWLGHPSSTHAVTKHSPKLQTSELNQT